MSVKSITIEPVVIRKKILVWQTDKSKYFSGETINISGILTYGDDGSPVPDNEINAKILGLESYAKGWEWNRAYTDSKGEFSTTLRAITVATVTTVDIEVSSL